MSKERWVDSPTMTVQELIDELKVLDPTLLVYTEGCDCIGAVQSIERTDEDSILLCREE